MGNRRVESRVRRTGKSADAASTERTETRAANHDTDRNDASASASDPTTVIALLWRMFDRATSGTAACVMALSVLALVGFFAWAVVNGVHGEVVTIDGARIPVLGLLAVSAMGTSGFAVMYRIATRRHTLADADTSTQAGDDQSAEREPASR